MNHTKALGVLMVCVIKVRPTVSYPEGESSKYYLLFIRGYHSFFVLALLQIQFSVHVFGSYNGTISFSVREERNGVPVTLPMWERAGSWSDHWFLITLPMPVLQNR